MRLLRQISGLMSMAVRRFLSLPQVFVDLELYLLVANIQNACTHPVFLHRQPLEVHQFQRMNYLHQGNQIFPELRQKIRR
jgi:hypothetical protein